MRLIVFDLDGTLLNSLEDLADSANWVLEQHGFPTHPVDAYRYFVGDGVRKLIERILPQEECTEARIEQCRQEFVAYYKVHMEDKTSVYEGITELLVELKNRGLKIAVATNKVHIAVKPLMEKYFPEIRFDSMIGQREGVPVKPAPQIMFDILRETGCEPSEALHVGDTATDMQLAHNAGVTPVGVLWGYRPLEELQEAGAKFIIEKPEELLRLVHEYILTSK
ncbi:MAG: HAD family hydrolase [Bacteroidales bacterium]|nr:HAD family hydrolase [Bacteroidales bacterium]MBR3467139.1 HAD family hydrolase [Bacteroidales bacterium]MBR6174097.1 HAD family hydrolase [Bacteroidales bacterium]